MDKEEKIYFTMIHHSDLTWQFTYEEYDKIREEQLNIVMGFFDKYPECGFVFDQAYVLENYLKRNPDKFEQIKKLFNNGNGSLEFMGGYSIPDMNLSTGESFLRNCMIGREYYEDNFNWSPECASLMDSFGTPIQTPQMLALLGYKYLAPGRMPNAPKELDVDAPFEWESLHGKSITVVPQGAGVDKTSYITNVPVILDEDERFAKTVDDLQNMDGNVLAYYISEVQLLDEKVFKYIDEANKNPDAKRKVTFGRLADYCKTIDKDSIPKYKGEFNPVFTGCYTSRITVKQQIREAENALFNAELVGALLKKEMNLKDSWTQLTLGEFHDAACGCHHDSCNVDVNNKLQFSLKEAKDATNNLLGDGVDVAIINPSTCETEQLVETTSDGLIDGATYQADGDKYYFVAKQEALSLQTYKASNRVKIVETKKCDTKNYFGETDYFTFDFTNTMPKIKSKRFEKSVFGQENFGEILFRHEAGTMWSEVVREVNLGAEYQEETVCDVEDGDLFIKVTTKGAVKPGRTPISGNFGDYWPGFGSLSFKKEYIFPKNLPHFRLKVTLDFTGCNTKVSLRVPVELNPLESTALFDTPFAAVARKPYYEVPYKYRDTVQNLRPGDYNHAKGDFPALHWVDYSDNEMGISIANNGTPGHHVAGKDIFISLLRSGTGSADGTMYPQPGAYDNGERVYEFAFTDHAPNDEVTAIGVGEILNRKLVVIPKVKAQNLSTVVKFTEPNIVVSAIYPKDGVTIVRAYEILGKETNCEIKCSEDIECFASDVYGVVGDKVNKESLNFAPYQIRTFVLK